MKLYKFHSINIFLLHSLRNKEHWACRFDLLNDPYELYFIDKTENNAYKNLAEGLSICCFTKTMSEILMWSHYADNHKGICLEFDIDEESNKGRLFEMEYDNSLTVLDEFKLRNDGTLDLNIKTNARFMTTKFKNWQYEEEIRVINILDNPTDSGKKINFIGNLTAIHFGTRASQNDIDLVKFNTTHFENLKYYKVDLDNETMKMDKLTEI